MIMKKILLGVLFIVVIITSYLVYKELSFSPLDKHDFQKLFKEYNGSFDKSCSKDFLGVSSNGELFEIYRYKINGGIINENFPKITEWEGKEITNEITVGKWKNCPLDNQTIELYKFTLTSNNLDDVKCFNSFNKEILNQKNYYSFIHFNELEQYFLLYCTDSQELYYIRRKGF
jgi:hypothetical protein